MCSKKLSDQWTSSSNISDLSLREKDSELILQCGDSSTFLIRVVQRQKTVRRQEFSDKSTSINMNTAASEAVDGVCFSCLVFFSSTMKKRRELCATNKCSVFPHSIRLILRFIDFFFPFQINTPCHRSRRCTCWMMRGFPLFPCTLKNSSRVRDGHDR